jgi:integration host factor subunit alpha
MPALRADESGTGTGAGTGTAGPESLRNAGLGLRLVLRCATIPVPMTKADIIDRVCERVGGFSKKEAADLVEKIFDVMKSTLEAGEKIKISGFGNFVVREKQPRPGRNPQTGTEITIDARKVLTFKPSPVLKQALNPG